MKEIVFFLEGQSEKKMLEGLIPNLIPDLFDNYKVNIKYLTFQGKQDLENKLYDRLKGWLKT